MNDLSSETDKKALHQEVQRDIVELIGSTQLQQYDRANLQEDIDRIKILLNRCNEVDLESLNHSDSDYPN